MEARKKEELDSIEGKLIWTKVNLPPGQEAIPFKTAHKRKTEEHGYVFSYKARLIAKRYVKKAAVDVCASGATQRAASR